MSFATAPLYFRQEAGHRDALRCSYTLMTPRSASGDTAVRGLLFDMGDILYDATVWRRWLWEHLTSLGLRRSYRALFRMWDEDFLNAVHCGREEYARAFEHFLAACGFSPDQRFGIICDSHRKKLELESATHPFAGVQQTLDSLRRQGLMLGVLSDSESTAESLRARLAKWDLDEYFQVVISSVDLGRTKPDPIGYLHAALEMGLPTEDIAFVGHEAEELDGAAAVGMRTIAFNHDSAVQADMCLSRFEQLLTLADGSTAPGYDAGPVRQR